MSYRNTTRRTTLRMVGVGVALGTGANVGRAASRGKDKGKPGKEDDGVLSPTKLPLLSGNGSGRPNGINDRGTIVGVSDNTAVRWTDTETIEGLGTLHKDDSGRSSAWDIRNDGTIVGTSSSPDGLQPFRWTEKDGMEGLGAFVDDPLKAYATGINDRGVIVGQSSAPGEPVGQAFRWTEDTGMENLGTFQQNDKGVSGASAVNNEGVVVGLAEVGEYDYRAYRWTEDEGMENLGRLSDVGKSSASDIANGGTIAGESNYKFSSPPNWHAVTWKDGEITDLGYLPQEQEDANYSRANGINQRGTVVGRSGYSFPSLPVRWVTEEAEKLAGVESEKQEAGVANDINARGDIVGSSVDYPVIWET